MLGEEPKCPLAQYKKCENNLMCHWCDGNSHYKNTQEETSEKLDKKKEAKKAARGNDIPKYTKGKKEGMDLEKRVAKRWNDKMKPTQNKKKPSNIKLRPSLQEEDFAEPLPEKKSPSILDSFSSNVPSRPVKKTFGQISTNEAKRQPNSGAMWFAKGDITLDHALMEVKERGTLNGRGEKTISIPKEWLTKQADEAFQEGRDFWYLAFAYKNDEDIYIIKPYDHEIEMVKELRRLQQENDELKNKLEERT